KNTQEMRIASIRGELRYWHRLLWGTKATSDVWGGAGLDKLQCETASASKIVLRLVNADNFTIENCPILPHKNNSPRINAISEKSVFEIKISSR
ncbi:MAG: hypothetical protein RRY34_08215, partial [Victivallaceae bacterium]